MRYGVVYVAFGSKAEREVSESRKGLPSGTNLVVNNEFHPELKLSVSQQAHLAKTKAFEWSPYEYTLMLDADTRIIDPERLWIGFDMLKDGWEVVMVPSFPPRPTAVLWHLTAKEKKYTLDKLGRFDHFMLNTGVMFFHKTANVKRLFAAWEREWQVFQDKDQGAFLRALRYNPVKLFLLGNEFNSKKGKVVKHLFGRAAA